MCVCVCVCDCACDCACTCMGACMCVHACTSSKIQILMTTQSNYNMKLHTINSCSQENVAKKPNGVHLIKIKRYWRRKIKTKVYD